MKKFFKVLFISLFFSSCLFGSIYASAVTFSCKTVSSAMISGVGEAERKGISDAKTDCRNHSKMSQNPYSPGSREYQAYQEAYNRTYRNCKRAR